MQMLEQKAKSNRLEGTPGSCSLDGFSQTTTSKVGMKYPLTLVRYDGKEIVSSLKFSASVVQHGLYLIVIITVGQAPPYRLWICRCHPGAAFYL